MSWLLAQTCDPAQAMVPALGGGCSYRVAMEQAWMEPTIYFGVVVVVLLAAILVAQFVRR